MRATRWPGLANCLPLLSPVRAAMLLSLLVLLALGPLLSGCDVPLLHHSTPRPIRVLHLATIFPMTGVDGPLGMALQRGVDLAVFEHPRLPAGYRIALTQVDGSAVPPSRLPGEMRNKHVLAIVGILESGDGLDELPSPTGQRIATIKPVASLPGRIRSLKRPRHSPASHLSGHGPVAFFQRPEPATGEGRVAADIATSSGSGLSARAVFLVSDGTRWSGAAAAAFATELRRKGGVVAGQRSLTPDVSDVVQATVTAIIEANPDLVFYAGDTAAGADLRRTLSLSGAPKLRVLTTGPIADNPGWTADVGTPAIAASTIGLLPARDLSALPGAKRFISMYRRAFPGKVLLPQTALAYDAAMDAIAAIRALIRHGKPITRASVRSAVATMPYRGVTGALAFEGNGNEVTSIGFSLYSYKVKGGWHYMGPAR